MFYKVEDKASFKLKYNTIAANVTGLQKFKNFGVIIP